MTEAPPLLVTLALDGGSFERLDGLRRRYFPPERNLIPAHVSLFHHLPPGEQTTVERQLTEAAARHARMPLHFTGLRRLGGGMAVEVVAPGLQGLHARLAKAFEPWLTRQDRQPFRPHVTVMNKAPPAEAARAFAELQAAWQPWHGTGEALLLWRYLGGPWEPVQRFALGEAT